MTRKAGLRCTACSICEKECPPQCIYIVLERDENGKSLKRPKVFDIDLSVCMNCGICAEVCPFDSIYMDGEYELSTDDRFGGLLFGLDRLSKSAEYHMQLRPEQASEVMARRKAEEEKKAAAAAAKAAKAKADAEAKKAAAEEKGGEQERATEGRRDARMGVCCPISRTNLAEPFALVARVAAAPARSAGGDDC
jgi:NADH-quinone oxidoreductase subunit I